ncbi:hypothetical protein ACFPM0_28845 [Pseudonocardia sulfidoxydans]|uniref:hypothetical protein n=1 Tax=Pseudonocardia sulfidoxydans TaxID=54011 RepID=UPI003618F198
MRFRPVGCHDSGVDAVRAGGIRADVEVDVKSESRPLPHRSRPHDSTPTCDDAARGSAVAPISRG